MFWNWEKPDWPDFTWKEARFTAAEERFRTGGGVFLGQPEILDLHLAVRARHPATLVSMIVNGASLAGLPADGNQLKQGRPVEEVPGVTLTGKVEVRRQAQHIDSVPAHVVEHGLVRELFLRDRSQPGSEFFDWNHVVRIA